MDFDLKSVSPPGGRPGSPRLLDGCHAICAEEHNLNWNVTVPVGLSQAFNGTREEFLRARMAAPVVAEMRLEKCTELKFGQERAAVIASDQ
jgi:hypothetical protein